MFNKVIHFSVYHRGTIIFLTAILAIAGFFFGFQRLPIDAVPDITNNQVQINTTVSGFAPEEIERSITYPVESAMRGLPNVVNVRSITRFGLSQVTVIFEDSVDIYRARQLVSERLQGVISSLPDEAEPKLGPVSTGLGEIYQYVIDYKAPAKDPNERFKQLIELRTLNDWNIKPRILNVPGIAEVNTSGGYEKQYQVSPRLEKMQSYGIHFSDISDALSKANKNVGGGIVQQSAEQFLVQGVGLFGSTKDIESIPVKQLETFRVIRLGEIADISLGKQQRTGASTYNGEEAVLGTAMMLIGENSRSVAELVDTRIQEIAKTLPPEFILQTVYDRSELVDDTLGTVEHNLIFGAALVIIVLFGLLGNARAAIITALTIPLTLCATFLIMRPLGLSGNLMSLGALDFGIIVDGTVIVLDNCVRVIQARVRELGRRLSKEEIKDAVYAASVEIRSAAGFGELIIVVVFLPIFGLVGVEGKMFTPMAASFAIAVFGALVLSFTFAPALASLILSGKPRDKDPILMRALAKGYSPILYFVFKARWVVIPLAIGAVVLSLSFFGKYGAVFLPQLGEGSYAFHMIRPVNVSINQSLALQRIAEKVLLELPEVSHVFSRIGTSEVATDPMGVNVSDTYIMLKDREKWPEINGKKETYESLVTKITKSLEEKVPGQAYLASQPIQMRFNELLEGTRADVAIKVFGPNLEENLSTAKLIQASVQKVPGAGDVELDLAGTSPVLKITPDPEAILAYGTSSNDILEAIEVALGGQEASFIYENDKKFPIMIRLREDERSDLHVIRTLPVALENGSTVALGKLAKVSFEETYGSVTRENGMRRSAVLVNLRGRDTESFVTEAQAKILKDVKIPDGIFVEWGGNFQNLKEARDRLLILTPIALCLVFFMVFVAFGNFIETILIFLCIPFAWVGGILNMNWHEMPFSISAGVGFIALSGIAVLNGVVLIGFYNSSMAEGKSGRSMIIEATKSRLRPVIMTALVAIFGFLPMMFSTGMGAEVQRPLATVVTGGVFSSTVLTLLLLPLFFSMVESRIKNFKAVKH